MVEEIVQSFFFIKIKGEKKKQNKTTNFRWATATPRASVSKKRVREWWTWGGQKNLNWWAFEEEASCLTSQPAQSLSWWSVCWKLTVQTRWWSWTI